MELFCFYNLCHKSQFSAVNGFKTSIIFKKKKKNASEVLECRE